MILTSGCALPAQGENNHRGEDRSIVLVQLTPEREAEDKVDLSMHICFSAGSSDWCIQQDAMCNLPLEPADTCKDDFLQETQNNITSIPILDRVAAAVSSGMV